ncbi:MAG TPA: hypothetical protein VGH19_06450 [Verrucomicrobiae bacterium]
MEMSDDFQPFEEGGKEICLNPKSKDPSSRETSMSKTSNWLPLIIVRFEVWRLSGVWSLGFEVYFRQFRLVIPHAGRLCWLGPFPALHLRGYDR